MKKIEISTENFQNNENHLQTMCELLELDYQNDTDTQAFYEALVHLEDETQVYIRQKSILPASLVELIECLKRSSAMNRKLEVCLHVV